MTEANLTEVSQNTCWGNSKTVNRNTQLNEQGIRIHMQVSKHIFHICGKHEKE